MELYFRESYLFLEGFYFWKFFLGEYYLRDALISGAFDFGGSYFWGGGLVWWNFISGSIFFWGLLFLGRP